MTMTIKERLIIDEVVEPNAENVEYSITLNDLEVSFLDRLLWYERTQYDNDEDYHFVMNLNTKLAKARRIYYETTQ